MREVGGEVSGEETGEVGGEVGVIDLQGSVLFVRLFHIHFKRLLNIKHSG